MAENTVKVLVWDVPTRVFHWLLAGAFLGAYLSGDSERWRDFHVLFGYTLMGLIGFRLVWGLVGSRYARFSDFLYGPARIARYLGSLLRGQPEHYLGHNPAGSLAIFALLALGLVTGASGLATYYEWGGEWLEEVHEAAANGMLAVVAIHIAGVIVSSVLHRENLARAMVTGKKSGRPEEGIGRGHAWVAVVLLAAVVAFWVATPPAVLSGGEGGHAGHEHEHDD